MHPEAMLSWHSTRLALGMKSFQELDREEVESSAVRGKSSESEDCITPVVSGGIRMNLSFRRISSLKRTLMQQQRYLES